MNKCRKCAKHGMYLAVYTGPSGEVVTENANYRFQSTGNFVCVVLADTKNEMFAMSCPGSMLKLKFRRMGAVGCQLCKTTAKRMDQMGASECNKQFDSLVAEIFENATTVGKIDSPSSLLLAIRSAAIKTTSTIKPARKAMTDVIARCLQESLDDCRDPRTGLFVTSRK